MPSFPPVHHLHIPLVSVYLVGCPGLGAGLSVFQPSPPPPSPPSPLSACWTVHNPGLKPHLATPFLRPSAEGCVSQRAFSEVDGAQCVAVSAGPFSGLMFVEGRRELWGSTRGEIRLSGRPSKLSHPWGVLELTWPFSLSHIES